MKMIKLRVKNSFSCSLEIYFKLQMSNLPSQFFLIIKFQNATLMEKKVLFGAETGLCVSHKNNCVIVAHPNGLSLLLLFFVDYYSPLLQYHVSIFETNTKKKATRCFEW